MIGNVKSIINSVYSDGRVEGEYLILEEPANKQNSAALSKISIRLHDVCDFAAYKFDQGVTINGISCETCLPFLSTAKSVRSMCDFVVFYSPKKDPNRVHAWVINLKSANKSNNAGQMKAGRRIAEFLMGKFEDVASTVKIGQINFVLFSSTLLYKSKTNPYVSVSSPPVVGNGTLSAPKNFVNGQSPALAPI